MFLPGMSRAVEFWLNANLKVVASYDKSRLGLTVMRPECCPFCRSQDLRPLTIAGVDLTGYRCHDCEKIFYVTADAQPAALPKKTNTKRGK
jgi:hypothetical protein